jgi:hypothetical protein
MPTPRLNRGYLPILSARPAAGGRLSAYKQIQFWDKVFTNEIIELDDREYYNCSFNNCTFRFGGGRHMMKDCQVSPTKRFETPNPQIANAISIMKVLGLLEPGFSQNWKHVPSDYFK